MHPVVHNLSSIEPQRFGEVVSGVRWSQDTRPNHMICDRILSVRTMELAVAVDGGINTTV